MDNIKIIELKETILDNNDADAAVLRETLKGMGIYYINVMSSPGAGKTSTIKQLIRGIGKSFAVSVMEADIDSDVDAAAMLEEGVPAVQLHTGGMCHLDADMSRQGLRALGFDVASPGQAEETGKNASGPETGAEAAEAAPGSPRVVILENVGNLVCPAEFDTGAALNLVILSVPEGDDKPLKYPLMFEKADLVLINKTDALPAFDFDMDRVRGYIGMRHPGIPVFPVSARTGEGFAEVCSYLEDCVRKNGNE